jgi:hypothetical protein
MKQRPPDADDPTSEEQPPEFDGTATDRLGAAYRVQVATNSESTHCATQATPALTPEVPQPKPLAEGFDPDATGVFVLPKIGP